MLWPVMETLEFIAAEPRPVESRHLRSTEVHITQRLVEAGLPVYVLEHHTTRRGEVSIRNIYSYIPGTTGQSVIFIAHYDSVPGSPGALDNGAAVAALLEIFISQPTSLQVGIQLLFTDGHEIGLGAHEFVQYHSYLLENTIFAFNFDGMGNGPLMPFQGGIRHGNILFEASSRPAGFSLLAYGVALDEWHFAQGGIPAMTIMPFARPWNYHTPDDTIENLGTYTLAGYIDTIQNLMEMASQAGWIEGFSTREKTFFMPVYGMLISYGPVMRWIIAGLMIAGIIAMIIYRRSGSNYRPFSQGRWDVNVKGIMLSLIGTLLFIVLFVGGTLLIFSLASNIGLLGYHTSIILTSSGIILILIPLAYYFLKLITSIAGWDSFALVMAIFLGIFGVVAGVLMPGLEYFPMICAGLIALRVAKPDSRVAYFFAGIIAGVLFLPLLYIMLTQLGVASPLSGLLFALFIPVFYVLTKDYPSVYGS